MEFVNRISEMEALNGEFTFNVLFGRRRVGKTTLIERWGKEKPLYYSQAIEGSESQQIEQIMADFAEVLPDGLTAERWSEFFAILSLIKQECIIVIDEFPYLARTEKSLSSRLQRWLDHKRPKNMRLILLGSSQTMMHSLFLSIDSPLFERADRIIHLEPMKYIDFCEALKLDPLNEANFEKFSLVGGIPKYWGYLQSDWDILKAADELYFNKHARLEFEPDRLLKDEDISGLQARAIFEAIGRGAEKPSEIAKRLGIHQTSLANPMAVLLSTSLVKRAVPFSESVRNAKKTLYSICDSSLAFWYGCYSPHRSRWHLYSNEIKRKLIHDHSAKILEVCFRDLFPDAGRYWEKDCEFDCVRFTDGSSKSIIISEIKHRSVTKKDCERIELHIRKRYAASKLASKYHLVDVEVLGTMDVIERLASSL